MNKKLIIISSFAEDEIIYSDKTVIRPGGPAFWISETLRNLNIDFSLLTSRRKAHVKVVVGKSGESGVLKNIYPITSKHIPSADMVLLSTIVDEFDLSKLSEYKKIFLDIQGYVRVPKKQLIIPPDICRKIILLKATKSEFSRLSIETRKHLRHCTVLITDGQRRLRVKDAHKTYFFTIPAIECPDTIGAGDVFFSAFISKFLAGHDISFCATFAIRYTHGFLKTKTVRKIFGREKNIMIGAIHFPPLLGYRDFPGFDVALNNALKDLQAFENGGVDAVIIENNYDIPHTTFVSSSVAIFLAFLAQRIRSKTQLPIGISVLWNDYRTALSIAKIYDLQFVRIPVFVDTVKASHGVIHGVAKEAVVFRKAIQAEHIAMLTDVHVKHSKLLSAHSLLESSQLAVKSHSDGVIVTGEWTGSPPETDTVKKLREYIGDFPIFIGSGVNEENVKKLFNFANGAIVSTSLKQGTGSKQEINIKPYDARINRAKVRALMRKIS